MKPMPRPQHSSTRPTACRFCVRAVSVGVQLAMLGASVNAYANQDGESIIKRTRHPANVAPTAQSTTEQSYTNNYQSQTHYTNGTDNLSTLGISPKFTQTVNDDTPALSNLANNDVMPNNIVAPKFTTQPATQSTTQPTATATSPTDNDTHSALGVFDVPANNRSLLTQSTKQSAEQNTIARQPSTASAYAMPRSYSSLNRLYQRPKNSCQGVWHYPTPTQTSPTGGLIANADYGYYNNADYGELSGNVEIVQDDKSIFANQIKLNTATGQASATGNVLFGTSQNATTVPNLIKHDMIGLAQKLDYNLNTGQAVGYDVAFASNSLHAHGQAGSLIATDPNKTILTNTSFSACPPDRRHWELSANEITLNQDTGRGVAKNTSLKLYNKTVLKLPYFNFPIDDRRASGFLLPNVGVSSQDGVELSLPYYFNLAPNYDATVTPTLYTNKNPRVSGEFRYLTQAFGQGTVQGAFLPSDRSYDHKNRGHLFFDHQWRPIDYYQHKIHQNAPNWLNHTSVTATYRHISDSDYFDDFDSLGLSNNPLNLPRRIQLDYHHNNVDINLKAETFQKLKGFDENGNPLLDKDRPYSRLPQLSVNYDLPSTLLKRHTPSWFSKNAVVTGTHNLGYFKKRITDNSDTEKSGFRAYNSFAMSYPMSREFGFFTPKIALSHLYMRYDEDSLDNQNLDKTEGDYAVFVPTLSVDTGLHFQKTGSPFGWADKNSGGYQLLSPRLKYQYSPHQDQSSMPNFDTSTASLSYDQLLSDSWFLGYDRLLDLHAITPAVNYRYIDSTGQTRLDLGVAEQFFLSDIKVGLDNTDSVSVKKGDSTGLSWRASIMPYQNVWIDGAGSLKRNYTPNTTIVSARYQPSDNTLFNVGMVNRKADARIGQLPLSAYTGAAIFRLNNRWQFVAQAQYDTHKNRLMDTLLGVNYEDCCVGVSLYGRQYYNDLRPNDEPNRAIMAELRLNGLTSKGQLNRLLSDKILGFDNIAEHWQKHKP